MRLNLPYSRHRRYLTGIDWIVAALDAMTHRATGGHNTFQIVLELKGALDPNRFRSAVETFTARFPVLAGRPSRDWTLAPYWKMPAAGHPVNVPVEFIPAGEQEVFSRLEESANHQLPDGRTHLAFRVFQVGPARQFIAAQFDHHLFDATGAELFLALFHDWAMGEDCEARISRISLKEPAHLSDWMHKFEAGKQLMRLLTRIAGVPLKCLPRPIPLQGCKTRFSVMAFTEEQARAIQGRADREAGFLMFMPYALAASLQALTPAFVRRGAPGREYLVSVSVDLRTRETLATKVFFNHMSFLFFQIQESLVADRKQLLESLRLQMYEQIKSGFPKSLDESSMLMRIMPLTPLSRLMLKPLRGEFASLGFTCVGKGGYPVNRFLEAELVNLVHMPLVPVPPGVGFFISQYGPKMNAVLSYLDGMLTGEDVRRLEEDVRRLL